MSIFDIFRAAPKLTSDVFDKDNGLLTQMGTAIGNLHLSDQERLIANAKQVESVQNYAIATLEENSERSKARRNIAEEWFKLQIGLIKLYVFCIFFDYLILQLTDADPDFSKRVEAITLSPYLWGITGAVSLFFFGSHALRSSKFAKGESNG